MEMLKSKIRHIPDFPKPGILFYDITTLLNDRQGFRDTIEALASPYRGKAVGVRADS
jgi:adenine phosphoribosyltransferase